MKYLFILGGYLGLISGIILLFHYFSDHIAELIVQKSNENLKKFKGIRH